ncbi:flippase-like domain-containing protein [candidate division KSB1 bacterium]|nr:flippase-like domain-containing protein [candidate division KSB1 bacterium]
MYNKIKRSLTSIAKIFVSVVLVAVLLRRIGLNNILMKMMAADPVWFFCGVFVFALSNFFGSCQWYLLLRSKQVPLPFWNVVSIYHVGLFFNNYLVGYIGGDAVRIYDVHKNVGDTTRAVSTVFFDRFVGFFILTSLAMVASLVLLEDLGQSLAVTVIIAILAVWCFGLLFLFNQTVARKFVWLVRFLPGKWTIKLRDIYVSLNQFRHDKATLWKVFTIAVVVQFLRVLTHYFAALAVGVHVHIIYFFVFIPIIALAASLPVSIGGIGVREQSGVSLFSSVGLASGSVVAFEFLAYMMSIVATFPGGVIFVMRRSLPAQEKAADSRTQE